jgi:hypothetical protein
VSGGGGPLERLAHPDAAVRRIALRDLARTPGLAPVALDGVTAALERETDSEAAALGASLLGRERHSGSRRVLQAMIDRPETPALAAHAARIALDRIDIGLLRAAEPGAGASGTMGS